MTPKSIKTPDTFQTFLKAQKIGGKRKDFLRSIFETADHDDLTELSAQQLLELANAFWTYGQSRGDGDTILRTRAMTELGAFDLIEIVTPDRAYLVDSVMGELSARAISAKALFHPIVKSPSGEVSMILILIPRQSLRARRALEAGLLETLRDSHKVAQDTSAMHERSGAARTTLQAAHGDISAERVKEATAFLEWLHDGNFIFLGMRSYDLTQLAKDESGRLEPTVKADSNYGLLRDPDLKVLRDASEPTVISPRGKVLFVEDDPVIIAKSNLQSRVHRRVRMDYISIKSYDDKGSVIGETRIIGLFTAQGYNQPASTVPLLREKIDRVQSRAGFAKDSHAAKTLAITLATYPRDELFQISEDDLLRISTGIVHVMDRPRTRIFVRRDQFDRFVSVLVFIPREQYSTIIRARIGEHLRSAFGGRLSAFYPRYSDEPVARVHFIIGVEAFNHAEPDIEDLETEIAALAQPWFASIEQAAEARGNEAVSAAAQNFRHGFSASYQERFSTDEALDDITAILDMPAEDIRVRAYRRTTDGAQILRAKIYRRDHRLELSDIMPIFGNMGVHVAQETGYRVSAELSRIWIHDYEMRLSFSPDQPEALFDIFEQAFLASISGRNDNDGFNSLILPQARSWRDIAFLRVLARYRSQAGLDPSEAVQIEALAQYSEITALLLDLKSARFDPELFTDMDAREAECQRLFDAIIAQLDKVTSLDHDRVLRRLALLLMASLRTNFYQRGEGGKAAPHISLKIASRELDDLPAPKPHREIFVWSPRIEGVHLRFGPVARGGLRWSDRRDDYRTEVLGLVKAQQVKNAVIVPVGSKGGFFPKALPAGGDRDAIRAEAVAAYTTFISGLLDVTDSYDGDAVRAPEDVVRWDDDDPYLVVAADKGTATFSDTANGIASDYDFWLDDAFASGGSVGYDHKKMGITARGGWEAVKRHFREIGKDIQTEPFDVIGVGDMSGDVFGNGMLLSKQIRLRAAFNHLDIFIDPEPDVAKSFKERERMFALPRSTWQDYNAKLISKGGGVFSRSAKSIDLSDEMKAMTGLTVDSVTPTELLHALLKSPTELLWFGGIGTYVKSSAESHMQVGDKANDALRVDGKMLKAKVIGEGANLGLTQAGRIEFAQNGGRLNTDAIDNSAGVDSSDHEVNIKILLRGAIASGALKANDRNGLLERMTDDVARLVLAHNYDQTGALSLAQMQAVSDHNAYGRFMSALEREGRLDRAVEGLPDSFEMSARASAQKGLTRPELAVTLAYAKIKLFDDLIDSDVADDPYFDAMLAAYFPPDLRKYKEAMAGNRLRAEIICSRLANLIVDTAGPLFMHRMSEQTNCAPGEIAKSFMTAYALLEMERLSDEISALDNQVAAKAQYDLRIEMNRVLSRVTAWMLRRSEGGPIAARIDSRMDQLKALDKGWLDLLSPFDRKRAEARIKRFEKQGIPQTLAEDVALLRTTASGFDVINFAKQSGWPLRDSARLYYDIGGRFKIDRLRNAALRATPPDHWDRLALRRITEDFYAIQGRLAAMAADHYDGKSDSATKAIIDSWIKQRRDGVAAYDSAFTRLSGSGAWSLAKFAIANAQLKELSV